MGCKKLMFAVRCRSGGGGVVLQILHSACGYVQDDKVTATFRMTRQQLQDDKKRLSSDDKVTAE